MVKPYLKTYGRWRVRIRSAYAFKRRAMNHYKIWKVHFTEDGKGLEFFPGEGSAFTRTWKELGRELGDFDDAEMVTDEDDCEKIMLWKWSNPLTA